MVPQTEPKHPSTWSSPPEGAAWKPFGDAGTGYLSTYYSDPIARYPVRAITKRADNKSDPNIETGTYGLFSTCEPSMRRIAVRLGHATIFFLASHRRQPRAVTGYYHIGWYTAGDRGAASDDWALAADTLRFVDPIPLASLSDAIPEAIGRFRTQRQMTASSVRTLRELVNARDDRTLDYLAEVSRIERFALARSGFSYPSWGRNEGFRRSDARAFLAAHNVSSLNGSRSGMWVCQSCKAVVQNAARLRQCPSCRSIGSLKPLEEIPSAKA